MKKSFITIFAMLTIASGAIAQEADTTANKELQEEQLGIPPEEPVLTPLEKLSLRTSDLENSVSKINKLQISGYIQTQYQYGQKDASLKVGNSTNETKNTDQEEGFGRFGIRRGRIKSVYNSGLASGTFEVDITEKGLATKNAFININDPWIKTCSFTAGVFDRPFGYELGYSSSKRESPEYSTVCQTLFPDEKDLGAMITLAPPQNTLIDFLKFKAGLFAGNGIKLDSKTLRDFICNISASDKIGSMGSWEIGFSCYEGGVFQGTKNVYSIKNNIFSIDSTASNYGDYAKREYFGFDAAFSYDTPIGLTKIMTEYLWGKQPGSVSSSKSPNSTENSSSDTFLRNFNGYYIMLVQDLGITPFSLVVKYDAYDPNTDINGNKIGATNSNTGKADLSKNTLGLGAIWRANNSLRFTAYYEFNKNEKSTNVKNYESDLKDNVFTLRMQYTF